MRNIHVFKKALALVCILALCPAWLGAKEVRKAKPEREASRNLPAPLPPAEIERQILKYGAEVFSLDPAKKEPAAKLAEIDKQLAVTPNSAELLTQAGVIRMCYFNELAKAEENLLAALKINPDELTALGVLGDLYSVSGRQKEAEPLHDRAMLLSMDSPTAQLSFRMMQYDDLDQLRASNSLKRDSANPVNAFWQAQCRKRILAADGKFAEVKTIVEKEGHLRDWFVLGCFGEYGGSDWERAFPPEKSIDLKQKFRRKDEKEIGWVRLADYDMDSLRDSFTPFVESSPGNIFYALTYLKADGPREVLLWLGSRRPLKLWQNDVLVYEQDPNWRDLASERVLKINLKNGFNKILVKTTDDFMVRMTMPDGAPVTEKEVTAQTKFDGPLPVFAKGADRVRPVELGSIAFFRALVEKQPRNTEALMEVAMYYFTVNEMEKALEYTRRIVAANPDGSPYQTFFGMIVGLDPTREKSVCENESKMAYEKSLLLNPTQTRAYRELAEIYKKKDPDKAVEYLQQALAVCPNHAGSYLDLADVYSSRGWKKEYRETIEKAVEMAPNNIKALNKLADCYLSYHPAFGGGDLGNLRKAEAQLKRLLEVSLYEGTSRLADFYYDHGREAEAFKLYQNLAAMNSRAVSGLIKCYRAKKQFDKAEEIVKKQHRLTSLTPVEELEEALDFAELRQDENKTVELLEKLSGQADYNGNVPEIKRFLEFRKSGKERPAFYSEFQADPLELARLAPPDSDFGSSHAVILYALKGIRVLDKFGRTEEVNRRIVKILTKKGAEDLGKSINASGTLVELRLFTPDGKITEPEIVGGSFHFPNMEPGCILDIFYTENGQLNSRGTRIMEHSPTFQDQYPAVNIMFVLDLPGDMEKKLKIVPRNMEGKNINESVTPRANGKRYQWSAKNIKKFIGEGLMPSMGEILPHVVYGEPYTVEELGFYLRNNLKGRFHTTDYLDEFTAKLLKDCASETEKVRKIYSFVHGEISEGYANDPTLTLTAKRGDRFALAGTMLKIAGLPCEMALASRVVHEQELKEFPSGRRFEAPLLRVTADKQIFWLSFEPRYMPFGRFALMFAGGEALVLGDKENRIEQLPPSDPYVDADLTRLSLKMDDEGHGVFKYESFMSSTYDSPPSRRMLLETGEQRLKTTIEDSFADILPRATIDPASFKFRDIKEFDKPLVVTFEGKSDDMLEVENPQIKYSPIPRLTNISKFLAGFRNRKHDIRIPVHIQRIIETRFEIPKGYKVLEAPTNLSLKELGFDYAVEFVQRDNVLTMKMHLFIQPQDIKLADYPKLVQFCKDLDAYEMGVRYLLEKPIEKKLVPKTPNPPAPEVVPPDRASILPKLKLRDIDDSDDEDSDSNKNDRKNGEEQKKPATKEVLPLEIKPLE